MLAAALLLAAPASQAQESIPPEVRAEGRRLQTEARAHIQGERWALAATAFERLYELGRAHGLASAPIALWDMSLALMRIPGREREARDGFRRFLDESTALTDDDEVRDFRSGAVERIAELDARIGDAEPSEPNATPAPAPEPEASVSSARASEAHGGVHPIGPVVLAVGGAALVAGVLIGAFSLGQASQFRGMCDDLSMCPTALRPQYDEMRALSAAADVLYVAGGITAALGLVLTLLVQEEPEERAVAMDFGCGPTGCRADIGGRF